MKVWKIAMILSLMAVALLALWGLDQNRPHIHRLNETPAPSLVWTPFSEAALEQAKKSGRPTLLDFWAEWCAACHLMQESTFDDPHVRMELSSWNLLRVDASNSSEEVKKLFQYFSVETLPTFIFFDFMGQEKKSIRLRGFESPDLFLARLLSEKKRARNPVERVNNQKSYY